ncbi:MAG: site-specific integrase [Stenomitos rutilans HA7619-LM2]|jgi:integrase|nr:site-specific integrase [Stenomitos rutilans HA7619-LM2]
MEGIEGRIKQANGRLKSAKVGITIETRGGRLVLRGTLPPRLGSSIQVPHQQRLTLGYHANPAGLKLAEFEARKIGALLDCGEFDWSMYVKLNGENDIQTVGNWVAKYERDYFTRKRRTPQTETTWNDDYMKVFSELPSEKLLTVQLLIEAIEAKTPDTRTRRRFVDVCTRFAKFAGIEANFQGLKGTYSSDSVVRDVPCDRQIVECLKQIPNRSWRWAYGMMATYGLRNHELFHLDCSKLPLLVVKDGTKTGYHRVHPFYPEWVEQWELANVQVPNCTGKNNSDLGNRVTHALKRYAIPFHPYDLRHAWAVRTIAFRVPTTLAARMMGHSVDVHERIYQQWITEDFETQVIQKLLTGDRPSAPL